MGYVSVADVRAEGLTDTTRYPDNRINTAIELASQYIDRATRQWFEPRTATVFLDGQDSQKLFLPIPVITVTELYINDRFDTQYKLPSTDYVVYNGRSFPDDRKNPKIQLKHARPSIYSAPPYSNTGRIFVKGPRNQKIVGSFGYVEADGSTPLLIQRACMKMTLRFVDQLAANGTGTGGTASNSGTIIGESTDGHFIQYAVTPTKGTPMATFGISKDPEVETVLAMYRAPLAIAVPGNAQFTMG